MPHGPPKIKLSENTLTRALLQHAPSTLEERPWGPDQGVYFDGGPLTEDINQTPPLGLKTNPKGVGFVPHLLNKCRGRSSPSKHDTGAK